MRIVFFGDIVGRPGRDALLEVLPELRRQLQPDLVIANAENSAGGWGITGQLARQFLSSGIDVLTLGNHTWSKIDEIDILDEDARVLRPANYAPGAPGRGFGLFRTASGHVVGVANLLGRVMMDPVDDPFRAADEIITALRSNTPILFIDFHAEATSEKVAFGWHCDGRVSAVVGTHTHIPTADERVLPGGTAYITDVGMCGPENSVIGMDCENVLARFRTQIPRRYRVADGSAIVNGVVIDIDPDSGKATAISRIQRRVA